MTTPGVVELSVPETAVAVTIPTLFSGIVKSRRSHGSGKPSPSPPVSAKVTVPNSRLAIPIAPAACSAWNAMMIPAPVLRSTPAVSMSIADDVMAVRICAGVSDPLADLISAAIAAACAAAEEVP